VGGGCRCGIELSGKISTVLLSGFCFARLLHMIPGQFQQNSANYSFTGRRFGSLHGRKKMTIFHLCETTIFIIFYSQNGFKK
jgi:hypothetical protein